MISSLYSSHITEEERRTLYGDGASASPEVVDGGDESYVTQCEPTALATTLLKTWKKKKHDHYWCTIISIRMVTWVCNFSVLAIETVVYCKLFHYFDAFIICVMMYVMLQDGIGLLLILSKAILTITNGRNVKYSLLSTRTPESAWCLAIGCSESSTTNDNPNVDRRSGMGRRLLNHHPYLFSRIQILVF